MKDSELIKRLRENAEWCDANEWEIPICMGDDQREAANRLEALTTSSTARTSIITCRNCKWDNPDKKLDKHWCTRVLGCIEVCADDYCIYGAKREEKIMDEYYEMEDKNA